MKIRPGLSSTYFKLLYDGLACLCCMASYVLCVCVCWCRDKSDVKHAPSYVEEKSTANVLADRFFE